MLDQSNILDPRLRYASTTDAFIKIFCQFGLKGVYKGFGVTMYRDVASYAIFFGIYEMLKKAHPERSKDLGYLMAAGAIAGIVKWTITYPIDVVKTRFQGD